MTDNGPNKSAPHNIEAEEAVLGCVLINPEAYTEMAGFLRAGDFYLHKHQWIWHAFARLLDQRMPIDILTVSQEMERRNQLAEAGGAGYLARLINGVPTSLHAEAYGRIVQRQAERRGLLELATRVAKMAYDETADLDTARSQIMQDLIGGVRLSGQAVHIREFVSDWWDETSARAAAPRDIFGLQTGFADFDKVTDGLQPYEGFILAGEPGAGKTQLAAQMAFQIAGLRLGAVPVDGMPVAIYELEMRGLQLVRRMAASMTGVQARRMRSGRVRDNEWQLLEQAAGEITSREVFMSDKTHWTTTSLRADLTRLVEMHGVRAFVVDYMNLLKDKVRGEEHERVAHISAELKAICKDLGLAGLFIQRLTKAGLAAGVPDLEHLAGSAAVPYDADTIAFITRHIPSTGQREDRRLRTITWGKVREGDAERQIHLLFLADDGIPAFRDLAQDFDDQDSDIEPEPAGPFSADRARQVIKARRGNGKTLEIGG